MQQRDEQAPAVTVEPASTAFPPHVSVIIPSWNGNIDHVRASLQAQTFQDFELVIVARASPAGRARSLGVAAAHGDVLVFVDDDAQLGHVRVLEQLVTTLDADATIGVVGTSKILAPDASALQQRIAREVPRWIYPVEQESIESNPPVDGYGFTGITTTCCAIRRAVFDEVGGFDQTLTTGEDPELFYRIRRAGYRFIIPRACWVYHNPPGRVINLLRKSYGYGIGHAQETLKNPERGMDLVPLDRWYGKLGLLCSPLFFVPLLFVHLYFDPTRHWRLGFLPIKTLSTYATLYGYAFTWFRFRRQPSGDKDTPVTAETPAPTAASASRSSTISGITFLSIAVLNNIYAIIMARILAVHTYGLLGLAQSWLLIGATLLGCGFPWELTRVLARGASLSEAYRTAKGALVGNLIVTCVFCATLGGAVLSGSVQFDDHGLIIIGLLTAETLLLTLSTIWSGVLQGRLRFDVLGWARFVEALIKLVGGVVAVMLGWGVSGALGALVLGTLALTLLLGWNARDFAFWRERSWGDWHIYARSLTIFMGLAALTIIGNIDIIGVKLFSPAQQADTLAGYYQSAAVLARIPFLLVGAYAAALFPYIVRAEEHELPLYVVRAMKYALLLIAPLNLILIAIPEAAIQVFFPAAYLAGAQALRLASLATLLLILATMLATILQARGQARVPARWLPIAAVTEIVALALMVPRYGIVGAAASLLLASAVTCVALAHASLTIAPWRLQSRSLFGYGVACAGLMLALVLLPHASVVWTLVSCVLALAVYVLVLALVGLLRPVDLVTLTSGLPLEQVPLAARVREWAHQLLTWLNQVSDGASSAAQERIL